MKMNKVIEIIEQFEESYEFALDKDCGKIRNRAELCTLFLDAWNNVSGRLNNDDKQAVLHPAGESKNGLWQEKFDGVNPASYFENIDKDHLNAALEALAKAEPKLKEYSKRMVAGIYFWNFKNNVLRRTADNKFDDLEWECDLTLGLSVKRPKGELDKIGVDAIDVKRNAVVQAKSDLRAFVARIDENPLARRLYNEYRALSEKYTFYYYDEKTNKFFDINMVEVG